ncbi:MAG: hypothetical protein F4213_15270 [Boseongicola sp. SB0677_bin_26]|nr:hypothetical protein [Boseongicola sp. SB0665_bin_10]MYG27360.1 hypothetical protein [Boseongicola sp. SB0677_bin_26]
MEVERAGTETVMPPDDTKPIADSTATDPAHPESRHVSVFGRLGDDMAAFRADVVERIESGSAASTLQEMKISKIRMRMAIFLSAVLILLIALWSLVGLTTVTEPAADAVQTVAPAPQPGTE